MKSIIMSIYLLSVSLGNWFTSGVNKFIMNEDGTSKLEGVAYHLFFAKCMGAATLVYIVYAYFYREQTFIQSSSSDDPDKHKGEHLEGA
jgi:proton-dependent oligopeptide transporter, POT family